MVKLDSDCAVIARVHEELEIRRGVWVRRACCRKPSVPNSPAIRSGVTPKFNKLRACAGQASAGIGGGDISGPGGVGRRRASAPLARGGHGPRGESRVSDARRGRGRFRGDNQRIRPVTAGVHRADKQILCRIHVDVGARSRDREGDRADAGGGNCNVREGEGSGAHRQ